MPTRTRQPDSPPTLPPRAGAKGINGSSGIACCYTRRGRYSIKLKTERVSDFKTASLSVYWSLPENEPSANYCTVREGPGLAAGQLIVL